MNNKGFKSNIGFILASVGSAVGLGNIWSFPYKLASGGALFLYIYCVLALVVGIPLLISELSIGRSSGSGAIIAYKKISPKLGFLGVFSVISPCIVMSYYSVIGGMCIRYFLINLKSCLGIFNNIDSTLLFKNISQDTVSAILFSCLFIIVTYLISQKGISEGIEKFNKIAMPMLFAILLITMFATLNQENANAGITHLFIAENKYTFGQIISTFSSAGEQMFFSLSIAVGTMVTYGSFMNKKQNIPSGAVTITIADSIVAFMAGLAIIPVAFSLNLTEQQLSGPGLLFVTMQSIFASDSKTGAIFGALFFLLVIIAAVSSAVAFLEVPVSAIMDMGIKNRKTVLIFCCMLLTVPSIIIASDGFRNGVMDLFIFIAEGLIIPITSLIFSVYIGWFDGLNLIIKEAENGKTDSICRKTFPIIFKFLVPIVLVVVIIGQIVNFLTKVN